MKEELKLREWQKKFKSGAFDKSDISTQIEAGWFDWFCRDTSLAYKTKKMGSIIKQIKDGGRIDLDNTYVFFKNNCPLNGPLYDSFGICNINYRDVVLFSVQINCCWFDHKYTVLGLGNAFEKPLFETNSSRELVKWLNTKRSKNYE